MFVRQRSIGFEVVLAAALLACLLAGCAGGSGAPGRQAPPSLAIAADWATPLRGMLPSGAVLTYDFPVSGPARGSNGLTQGHRKG